MANQELILNNRYKLLEQKASGGMAVVYRAQDLQLRRVVAVKVLRPSLTGDAQFLERFQQEARNVANLSHPNIVTVHDFQQDGTTYYIVMEWIEGQDLKKIIRQAAPLPLDRVLTLAIQICRGIGYAHRAGLVHADVKPQNILVTGEDTVKVTDFGIAQALAHTQPVERQSVVWGSPHYFAPEQAQGELPTPASDVYSIGIVLFEMLTGKLPFSGTDQQELAMAHIKSEVPHVNAYNPRVPHNLDRIIHKIMSKNPNDRYANADALGRILEGYKQQGQEMTMDQPALKDAPRPASAGFAPAAQTFNPAPPSGATSASPAPGQGFTPTPPPVQPAQPQPIPQQTRTSTPPPQQPVQPQPIQPAPQQNRPVPPQVAQNPAQPSPPNYAPPPPGPQQYSGLYSVGNPANPSVQQPYRPGQPQQPYNPAGGNNQPVYSGGQVQRPSVPYASPADGRRPQGATPSGPNYELNAPPSPINTVTIVLGIIAAVLVLGLIVWWMIVFAALGG
jgi:eukaryotic-like serine/threonine-protein kinase